MLGRWFERREIALLSVLHECQDSTLHLTGSRTATPAVSEMLFDLRCLFGRQLTFKRQQKPVFVRMSVGAKRSLLSLCIHADTSPSNSRASFSVARLTASITVDGLSSSRPAISR